MPIPLTNGPITIYDYTANDEGGPGTRDNPRTVQIYGWSKKKTLKRGQSGETLINQLRGYCFPDTVIKEGDSLTWRNKEYCVKAAIERIYNDVTDHIEITCEIETRAY